MKINNANEASEIVRDFLSRMGWSTFISPTKADKTDGSWLVEFRVGLKDMRFELKADTGEILRYETLK